MPFSVVRQDITKMKVDAIVNAANTDLANRAHNFHADSEGSHVVYESLAKATVAFREAHACTSLVDDWGAEIQADFIRRGGRK